MWVLRRVVSLISFQGPEWGWLLGYFLRAYLHFDIRVGEGKTVSYRECLDCCSLHTFFQDPTRTLHRLHRVLLTPRNHIRSDPWASLPELTNENGAFCSYACNSQAWSVSTMLDFLEEAYKYT